MTTVKFADLCDAADCLKRSDEYASWPTCRACGLHTCTGHSVPKSEKEEGSEDQVVTVYCTNCLATWGPE